MKKLNLQALQTNLDHRMQQNLDECKISGASVYVHQDGQPDFIRCYGKTNTDTGEAMPLNAIFRLASMTKPITAAAVLLQVQRGLLDLDAPVETYLPAFANMMVGREQDDKVVPDHRLKEPIRVFHLLTHTSGVIAADFVGLHQSIPRECMSSLAGVVDYIGTHILLSNDPMDNAMYSPCSAFDVAARLVEITSGFPYAVFLRRNLFDPLDMPDTTFFPSDEQWGRMTAMHNRVDGQNQVLPMDKITFGDFPLTYTCGGASLTSTLTDYAHFAEMLLHDGVYNGRQILTSESVAAMRLPRIPETVPGISAMVTWGLGVRVLKNHPVLPRGTFGWSGAYGTHFFVDPENKLFAVYMKNSGYDGGAGAQTANEFEEDVENACL